MSLSSRPCIATTLCFSRDDNAWAIREVADDDRWHGVCTRSVVSHDHNVHCDSRLVFIDLRRGLLLFHLRLTESHFIDLPDANEGGRGGEVNATIDSSEGRIMYLLFYEVSEGMMVWLWSLSDKVFNCNERLLSLRGVRSVGPVDPYRMT
jgi:hypothetical protein